MNELIPDKQAYQVNKRRMAWTALGMMIVSTIAVLIDPARMAEADAVLMMMYGSLSALVGAYFGFSGVAAKKWLVVNLETHLRQIREQPLHGNPPL
jgi:cell division protein FtsW (lipid II flippase)